ncbi:large proline-rich protein BAG6-like isoform X4 [Vanessa atalanta]|uniref:large proline-rich protein BAG6-like isoform X4 n=1 Tax=Vanessa atalanta TaxID=42275 RepID=UPI001FCDB8B0|nr:large proline-rich protein BAG6-like isoform X4 [Vanessa atalanta]
MIEFTIKTLDGKDHRFTVEDDITVAQLKEKVLAQMGVEIELQRLIFCGRVLQDEKKLADYGVQNKVIHMVQRAPPCLEARYSALREREREREREQIFTNQISFNSDNLGPVQINTTQQMRRLVALAATANGIEIEDEPANTQSPTAARMEFLRHIIEEIKAFLEAIKLSESDEPRNYPTDDPLESTSGMGASSSGQDEVMCEIHQSPLLYQIEAMSGASRESRGRRIRAMRPIHHTPPRDFADLLEELNRLYDEFAPFRDLYIGTLRDANSPGPALSEENLQRRQRTAEICSELYHSFSHAFHAVSDVSLLLNNGNSRLTSEALLRHTLPVQAHINVVQSSTTRRPLNSSGPINGSNQMPADAQPVLINSSQPDFENLFRGLGQGGSLGGVEVVMSMEEIPQAMGGQGQNNNAPTAGAPQPPEGGAAPQAQFGSQVFFAQMPWNDLPHGDLVHNIVSSVLRHGLPPGVEGFYHLPNAYPTLEETRNMNQYQALNQALNQAQYRAVTQALHEAQMEAQREDELEVQRQTQRQTQSQAQNQSQSQAQSRAQTQNQAQNQGDSRSHSSGQSQTPAQVRDHSPHIEEEDYPEPSQGHTQGQLQRHDDQSEPQSPFEPMDQYQENDAEENANMEQNNRSRRSIFRRQLQLQQQHQQQGARPRVPTLSIHTLAYDRFLPCDSHHARRQLHRRREQASQNGGLLLRDSSLTRVQNSVETLFERFDRYTNNEESLLIAAVVTLREATSFSRGRSLVPEELLPLRERLQVYMRNLMQGEYEVGTQEQLADLIFERHSRFIERIAAITPIRQNVDIVESMKAVLIRFLNEAMTVLDMENNESFSRRFRIVIPRMFYELCGVISYFCLEGVEGLRTIYRSFLADLLQNLDEPARDLLFSIAMENLNAAIYRIESHKTHYAQFIRRKPMRICPPSSDSEDSFPTEEDMLANQRDALPCDAFSHNAHRPGAPPRHQFKCPGNYAIRMLRTRDPAERSDAGSASGSPSSSVPTSSSAPAATSSAPASSSAMDSPSASLSPTPPSAPATPTHPTASAAPTAPSAPIDQNVPEVSAIPEVSALSEVSTIPEVSALSEVSTIPEVSANFGIPVPNITHVTNDNTSASNNVGRGRFIRGNRSGSTTSSDSSGNIRFVPPAQIAQHWGEDWVPTFTRDLQRQRDTAEPYSDAYLSGMPPKKRRCVRQSRPPTTLNAFINDSITTESVSEVSSELDEDQGEELRVAFREHVRCIARARAAASEDYEPRRLVATARFLNQNRTSTRKSPDKNSSE